MIRGNTGNKAAFEGGKTGKEDLVLLVDGGKKEDKEFPFLLLEAVVGRSKMMNSFFFFLVFVST